MIPKQAEVLDADELLSRILAEHHAASRRHSDAHRSFCLGPSC